MTFKERYEPCTVPIAKCLIAIEQIGWFMSDGAAFNGASLCDFKKELDSADEVWDAKEHDILCGISMIILPRWAE